MPEHDGFLIRKARLGDVEKIYALMKTPVGEGQVLARSRMELYTFIRDYFVGLDQEDNVVGLAGLHICWQDLAEIRSLIVAPDRQGLGLGRRMVEVCLDEAQGLGLRRVFVLTNSAGFFSRLGFGPVDKSTLPHKIWTDCVNCLKFPDECDEVPMVLNL